MIWWFIFLAVILILIGIAYLRGKCDGFIAGYNTSFPEKQKKYDIKRLRLIVACFHFALAALFFLYLMKDSDLAATIHLSCVAALSIAAVLLANTWAKKRGNLIRIRMDADRKDYLLYPAITAAIISGLNAFSDWRRGTLESIWWYVIAALILYAILREVMNKS